MDNKKSKKNKIKDTYYDIVDRLSLKTTGFSAQNNDKYFAIDNDKPPIIDKLAKTFNIDHDKSITNVNWKKNGTDLGQQLEDKFNEDTVKDMLHENISQYTNDKLKEHLYIRKYMPQVERVITAKVDAVMSPNTQSRERVDISKVSGDVTITEIKKTLEEVKLNTVVQEALMSSYTHGSAFVYVYPYSELANDIMEMKDAALFSASVAEKEKKLLFGESYSQTKPKLTKAGFKKLAEFKLFGEKEFYTEADGSKVSKNISNDAVMSSVYSTMIHHYDSEAFAEASLMGDEPTKAEVKKTQKKKINNLTGAHVKRLDNLRCIPIYISDELIGVYYIDSLENFGNITTRMQTHSRGLHSSGVPLEMKLKLDIIKEMKTEISEKFLFDNKNILVSLDQILKDTAMESKYKIRFIPRKYLVEFPHHMRVSNIQIAESLALIWIDLMKNYVFKKLFYEKDKFITYYTVDKNDDLSSLGYRAVDAVRNMVPSPADILNLKRKHIGLMNLHNITIPQTPQKVRPVEFEVKEGQKAVVDEFEDLIKLQSQVTELLGFNYNALDPSANTDFALNIIASDNNKAEMILVDQAHYNPYLSELVNKIVEYKFPHDNVKLDVKFPEQRVLKNQIFNSAFEQITGRIETIIKAMNNTAQEEDKEYYTYMYRELFKDLGSTMFDVNNYEELEAKYKKEKERKGEEPKADGEE